MNPLDLIALTHRQLTEARRGAPLQIMLKRAISNAYYAVFLELCATCADSIVGRSRRNTAAWRQVYRAVEHGYAKHQCLNKAKLQEFSREISDFAESFAAFQDIRHDADYDPSSSFRLHDALVIIESARVAIANLRSASKNERTDFAVWVLLKHRQ